MTLARAAALGSAPAQHAVASHQVPGSCRGVLLSHYHRAGESASRTGDHRITLSQPKASRPLRDGWEGIAPPVTIPSVNLPSLGLGAAVRRPGPLSQARPKSRAPEAQCWLMMVNQQHVSLRKLWEGAAHPSHMPLTSTRMPWSMWCRRTTPLTTSPGLNALSGFCEQKEADIVGQALFDCKHSRRARSAGLHTGACNRAGACTLS